MAATAEIDSCRGCPTICSLFYYYLIVFKARFWKPTAVGSVFLLVGWGEGFRFFNDTFPNVAPTIGNSCKEVSPAQPRGSWLADGPLTDGKRQMRKVCSKSITISSRSAAQAITFPQKKHSTCAAGQRQSHELAGHLPGGNPRTGRLVGCLCFFHEVMT